MKLCIQSFPDTLLIESRHHQRAIALLSHLIMIEPQLSFTEFVETAQCLGFKVSSHWDPDTPLPMLLPLH